MQRFKKWAKAIVQRPQKKIKSQSYNSLASITNESPTSETSLIAGLPLKSRLPGFVYGPLRNICPFFLELKGTARSLKIELINETPEILNFNFVGVWVKDKTGNAKRYDGLFECHMSSVAEVLPDPGAAMRGDERNSVSAHSKREVRPWWRVTFSSAIDIVAIEFCNRKDTWGIRSRGAVFSLYDDNEICISRYSRVIGKEVNQSFAKEGLGVLKYISNYFVTLEQPFVGKNIEDLFLKWLRSSQTEDETQAKLLEALSKADAAISFDTPDLGGQKENANQYDVPTGIRNFRVIAFAQKMERPLELNVDVNGNTTLIQASASDVLEDELLGLRRLNWMLQGMHVFDLELDPSKPSQISIWHGGYYSATAFVQRIVQVSEDGSTWHTLETSLENMTARLHILQCMEWLTGKSWTEPFCYRLGHFMATYRIAHARAVKALFSKQRHLMPVFFNGIDSGAQSAKYLPRVTYARHGLVVPLNEIDSAFLANRMKRFSDFVKERFNLDTFLCYGTLLGIYRDGDFLPHDDDVDLAVVVDLPEGESYRSASEKWVLAFEKVGLKCRLPTPTSLNMHCYFEDFDMDLFFIYRMPDKPDQVWTHMEGYRTREVRRELIEPLSSLVFKGVTFNTPANVEGFLEDRYGKGWVTPDPTYEL